MIERIAWLLLAALHVAPALAAVQPQLLARLYGVEGGGVVATLLQHRAALFAVVVAVCGFAAVDPTVRRLATVATGISIISFLAIYATAGQPAQLRTIAVADLAGLCVLAYAGWRAFG